MLKTALFGLTFILIFTLLLFWDAFFGSKKYYPREFQQQLISRKKIKEFKTNQKDSGLLAWLNPPPYMGNYIWLIPKGMKLKTIENRYSTNEYEKDDDTICYISNDTNYWIKCWIVEKADLKLSDIKINNVKTILGIDSYFNSTLSNINKNKFPYISNAKIIDTASIVNGITLCKGWAFQTNNQKYILKIYYKIFNGYIYFIHVLFSIPKREITEVYELAKKILNRTDSRGNPQIGSFYPRNIGNK